MSYVIVSNRFNFDTPSKKCIIMGIPEEVAIARFPHEFNCKIKTATLGSKLQDAVKVEAFPHMVFEELKKMGYELVTSNSHHEYHIVWTFVKRNIDFQ